MMSHVQSGPTGVWGRAADEMKQCCSHIVVLGEMMRWEAFTAADARGRAVYHHLHEQLSDSKVPVLAKIQNAPDGCCIKTTV